MASYKLSPAAENDLYQIWLYGLEKWGEDAADQYIQSLLNRFQQIANYPSQYPEVDHIREGYRRSVYKNNSIYFCVNDNSVEIMAIIGKQNFP